MFLYRRAGEADGRVLPGSMAGRLHAVVSPSWCFIDRAAQLDQSFCAFSLSLRLSLCVDSPALQDDLGGLARALCCDEAPLKDRLF